MPDYSNTLLNRFSWNLRSAVKTDFVDGTPFVHIGAKRIQLEEFRFNGREGEFFTVFSMAPAFPRVP
ncbi:hypothetical protein KP22_09585 [Pectobacterium betavasculorum]|uniref:Uncharacterized protein n=1 Tax=Pectobacterium betavasculorum TaxID=55207 RepID=A0A093VID7_9GAMM|nr:hypothetical protein [Pectobacterium betavasculorum]KFX06093.1 hypothetical protein KP22_09585 [Pectobacterium betavasculorum]KFX20333.1 hypothetical protein JV35_09500 [Pectobacterium betavasculorum]